MKLKRMRESILEPIADHAWESQAVLNPGTVRDGEVIHMLYRAVEGANFSTIGYAKLNRHGDILERRPEPVIKREEPYEKQGCEDPRIVKFEDTYYIFYSAYDGVDVRVCAASTKDFSSFRKHGIIIPGIWDKDAMIFPEKINGKVILIHRIDPDIQFAAFDSIEELLQGDPAWWRDYQQRLDEVTVMKPLFDWEKKKIGAGAPPIKTPHGWLLIYHGVDENLVYRGGAALLDRDDPTQVIARLPEPIIEPTRKYERVGDVPNVVFPEGTALFGDELLVFYGGADKVIAMASVNIHELVDALLKAK